MGLWGEKGGVGWPGGGGLGRLGGAALRFQVSGWGAPLFAAVGVLAMSSATFAAPCIYIYIYMYPNISIYGLVGKKAGRNVTVSE